MDQATLEEGRRLADKCRDMSQFKQAIECWLKDIGLGIAEWDTATKEDRIEALPYVFEVMCSNEVVPGFAYSAEQKMSRIKNRMTRWRRIINAPVRHDEFMGKWLFDVYCEFMGMIRAKARAEMRKRAAMQFISEVKGTPKCPSK